MIKFVIISYCTHCSSNTRKYYALKQTVKKNHKVRFWPHEETLSKMSSHTKFLAQYYWWED